VYPSEALVDRQSIAPDEDDAGENPVGLQKALCLDDGVAEAGVGCQSSPQRGRSRPAHGDAQVSNSAGLAEAMMTFSMIS